jgi:hypothetical protein
MMPHSSRYWLKHDAPRSGTSCAGNREAAPAIRNRCKGKPCSLRAAVPVRIAHPDATGHGGRKCLRRAPHRRGCRSGAPLSDPKPPAVVSLQIGARHGCGIAGIKLTLIFTGMCESGANWRRGEGRLGQSFQGSPPIRGGSRQRLEGSETMDARPTHPSRARTVARPGGRPRHDDLDPRRARRPGPCTLAPDRRPGRVVTT